MPANPQVTTGALGPNAVNEQKTYGHNAINADGSLDPNGTFNVSAVRLKVIPTDASLKSQAEAASASGAARLGWQASTISQLQPPYRGWELTVRDPKSGYDGMMRILAIDDVAIVAIAIGSTDAERTYFLDSFARD
jgi:hypothetical protein